MPDISLRATSFLLPWGKPKRPNSRYCVIHRHTPKQIRDSVRLRQHFRHEPGEPPADSRILARISEPFAGDPSENHQKFFANCTKCRRFWHWHAQKSASPAEIRPTRLHRQAVETEKPPNQGGSRHYILCSLYTGLRVFLCPRMRRTRSPRIITI